MLRQDTGCHGTRSPGVEFVRRRRRECGDSSPVGRRTGAWGDSGRWCCLGPGRFCRGGRALSPGTWLPAGLAPRPARGLGACSPLPFPPWAVCQTSPPARASPLSLLWSGIAPQSPAPELSAVGTKGLGAGVWGDAGDAGVPRHRGAPGARRSEGRGAGGAGRGSQERAGRPHAAASPPQATHPGPMLESPQDAAGRHPLLFPRPVPARVLRGFLCPRASPRFPAMGRGGRGVPSESVKAVSPVSRGRPPQPWSRSPRSGSRTAGRRPGSAFAGFVSSRPSAGQPSPRILEAARGLPSPRGRLRC